MEGGWLAAARAVGRGFVYHEIHVVAAAASAACRHVLQYVVLLDVVFKTESVLLGPDVFCLQCFFWDHHI